MNSKALAWNDARWAGLKLEDLVIYGLHVGTFSAAGNFDGVAERLADLRDSASPRSN
jgi:maltooligosyltrehalose trehalohydrolase